VRARFESEVADLAAAHVARDRALARAVGAGALAVALTCVAILAAARVASGRGPLRGG
jgi:hypothetical protein